LPVIAFACDVICLGVAGWIANLLYRFFATGEVAFAAGTPAIGLAAAAIFGLFARNRGLYRIPSILNPDVQLAQLALVFASSILLLICLLFLLKIGAEFSRGTVVVFAVLGLASILAARRFFGATCRSAVQSGAVKGRSVVTLGEARELQRLSGIDLLQFGVDEVARIALAEQGGANELTEVDRGKIARAVAIAHGQRAEEFVLIMPWGRDRALSEVLEALRASPLPVRLYPDHKVRGLFNLEKGRSLERYFSVLVQRGPLSVHEQAIKRALDVFVAASLLIVLAPILLATSLLIKLDSPGPVIFKQRRSGFDGREFVIFKFRTMTVLEDGRVVAQVRRGDPRVTRLGRALRRSSIDELPQLLNVLRGHMSLVGPRPHALAHDEEYGARIGGYALRYHVKPGLTGAAQVAGWRGETMRLEDMERRIEKDLWYVNNWSLRLDLKIFLQTFVALLRDGAY
jgi:undecaprenyl-phosphate galactose phosphotransferase/putative colanic acid biosynthesis UDP-glucose lipid carrier transferase